MGFIGLPEMVQVMLPNDIAQVTEGTVVEKKECFVLIRQARETNGDDRTADGFSNPKSSLQKWVSL